MSEHLCCTCPVLRPSETPNVYDSSQACRHCRNRLRADLTRLPDLYAQLTLSLEPVRRHGPRVSGTPTRSLGVHLEPLNLLSPVYLGWGRLPNPQAPVLLPAFKTVGPPKRARTEICADVTVIDQVEYRCERFWGHVELHRQGEVRWKYRQRDWYREPVLDENGVQKLAPEKGHDQVGPVATLELLDMWCENWRSLLYPDHSLPNPTITELTSWLANRVDYACDHHPSIEDFAAELADMVRVLSTATNAHSDGFTVGRCPKRLRDESRCNTRLQVDPYADVIHCSRCKSSWHRRKGEWLKLRGEQLKLEEAA